MAGDDVLRLAPQRLVEVRHRLAVALQARVVFRPAEVRRRAIRLEEDSLAVVVDRLLVAVQLAQQSAAVVPGLREAGVLAERRAVVLQGEIEAAAAFVAGAALVERARLLRAGGDEGAVLLDGAAHQLRRREAGLPARFAGSLPGGGAGEQKE